MTFNFELLHTTTLGEIRIKKNLDLKDENVLLFCKNKIKNSKICEKGKNFYCKIENMVFVVNKSSKTIITAHKN